MTRRRAKTTEKEIALCCGESCPEEVRWKVERRPQKPLYACDAHLAQAIRETGLPASVEGHEAE